MCFIFLAKCHNAKSLIFFCDLVVKCDSNTFYSIAESWLQLLCQHYTLCKWASMKLLQMQMYAIFIHLFLHTTLMFFNFYFITFIYTFCIKVYSLFTSSLPWSQALHFVSFLILHPPQSLRFCYSVSSHFAHDSSYSQSTGPWKMSLMWPCSPVSHVPQKGQAAWKACVPCGSGIWLQPCTVFSEHTWPQGQNACVGGPASRYRPPSHPSQRGT